MRRQAFETPERTHTGEFNACIADALKNGYATRSPESGLFYVVMTTTGANVQDALQPLALQKPWVFDLNECKNQRAWAPYVPFILCVAEKDHLWAFIRGGLYMLVLVELDTLAQIAIDSGYEAKLDPNNEKYFLRLQFPGADGTVGISSQLLARIGMECVSSKWAVLAAIETIKRGVEAIAAEDAGRAT